MTAIVTSAVGQLMMNMTDTHSTAPIKLSHIE